MEQLFFAGKAYLKINSLVKTPLHEFMAVERSGLWAPDSSETCVKQTSLYLDSQTLQVARGHENQANETLARLCLQIRGDRLIQVCFK